ncbi:uncharacterized protein Dsimw501_GD29031 [Drosophila simulans]|uniref:Uncharacterized protein n=1 Tax=Drosophila simulans TaxID=7240 RepID=A0A0J9UCR0_DROSI|nr:uncharacterized protein Dsimw501_GD29031 [Drosophila simulans]
MEQQMLDELTLERWKRAGRTCNMQQAVGKMDIKYLWIICNESRKQICIARVSSGIEFRDHRSQPQSQTQTQSQSKFQVPVPGLGPSIQQNHKTETKRRQLRCCGYCAPRALHAKRQFRYKMSKPGRLEPWNRVSEQSST